MLTNDDIINQIIERPVLIEINGDFIRIEPASMGKTFLMSRLISELRIREKGLQENLHAEIVRIVKSQKDVVTRLIAYYLCNTKAEIFDVDAIQGRFKEIDELEIKDVACLLECILTAPKMTDFASMTGIEKEQQRIRDIEAKKEKDKGGVQAGGVSIYGSVIDAACERYGWTYEYVVWGISYTNLQLMLADAPRTIILNEKERKRVSALIDTEKVNGDDKEAMKALKMKLKKRK